MDEATDVGVEVGTVVQLAWGEPVEELTALVQHVAADGLVVALVPDLVQLDGDVWLATTATHSVAPVPEDAPVVRHLRAVGVRRDPARVTYGSAFDVLAALAATGELVWVQDVEDGSDEAHVGRVVEVGDGEVVLDDVDPGGQESGGQLVRQLAELTRLEWGTDYLRALTVLNALPPDEPDEDEPA